MSLLVQDMRFSYHPFQDVSTLKNFVPWPQSRHKLPSKSSYLIGKYHERLVAHITWGKIIRWRKKSECDISLSHSRALEIKSWHCRLHGRKNWIFWPKQLENMEWVQDMEKYFTALFCYWLGAYSPEELSRKYGRNFIQSAESMFVIFMKYSDCLNLYREGLMSLSSSAFWDRRVLLFQHVLKLIHTKIHLEKEQIFVNTQLTDDPTLGLIWKWTREKVRNIVIWVNIDPTLLIPLLHGDKWRKNFSTNPVPVI